MIFSIGILFSILVSMQQFRDRIRRVIVLIRLLILEVLFGAEVTKPCWRVRRLVKCEKPVGGFLPLCFAGVFEVEAFFSNTLIRILILEVLFEADVTKPC